MKHIFNLSFILIFFISCSQKKGNNDQEMLAKDNKDIISLEKIEISPLIMS